MPLRVFLMFELLSGAVQGSAVFSLFFRRCQNNPPFIVIPQGINRMSAHKDLHDAPLRRDIMAREFAKQFYSSKAWQDCRNQYAARRGHLCENCLRKGIYRPGDIVHHKIGIDPVTVNNPEVSLNPDNLELLCRDCHAERHKSYSKGRRFTIAEDGRVYAT